jgi:hypothetical protein
MLDFYNEEVNNKSPSSFNSRSSEESENENTDRQAYEMTEVTGKKEREIEIKYRRVDRVDSTEEDEDVTFID